MKQKVWYVVKGLIIQGVLGLFALIIAGGVIYYFIGFERATSMVFTVKAPIMILINVVYMGLIVVLLAYGLFNIPVYLWRIADNKYQLYLELERAHLFYREHREAMIDFHT